MTALTDRRTEIPMPKRLVSAVEPTRHLPHEQQGLGRDRPSGPRRPGQGIDDALVQVRQSDTL